MLGWLLLVDKLTDADGGPLLLTFALSLLEDRVVLGAIAAEREGTPPTTMLSPSVSWSSSPFSCSSHVPSAPFQFEM